MTEILIRSICTCFSCYKRDACSCST